MRSGSVAKVTSSVADAATTQPSLNVLSVGEETHFLSPAPSFVFPWSFKKDCDVPIQRLLEPWFKEPSHGGPCYQVGHMKYLATKLVI